MKDEKTLTHEPQISLWTVSGSETLHDKCVSGDREHTLRFG